jgi:hypothetical protein
LATTSHKDAITIQCSIGELDMTLDQIAVVRGQRLTTVGIGSNPLNADRSSKPRLWASLLRQALLHHHSTTTI